MLWIAATIYAAFLFLVAAIPFRYIHGNAYSIWGGGLAALGAIVIGLLVFAFYRLNFYSYSGWFIMALSEEAVRGLLLYRFVLRIENKLVQRALFGATFGWLEFLLRLYPYISSGCEKSLVGYPCEMGISYIAILWAETILFHIFITAIGYRDATSFKGFSIALFSASVFHATYNMMKSGPLLNIESVEGYVVFSTCYIVIYAIVSYLVYLQNKGNLTLLNK